MRLTMSASRLSRPASTGAARNMSSPLGAPWCSLQACNALDRLGEAARPVLPSVSELIKRNAQDESFSKPQAYPPRILGHLLDVLEGRVKPLAGQGQ